MKKNTFRKGLVFGIILLFVGAGVIPSMGGTIVERHVSQDNKTSFTGINPRGNILYVGGSGPGNYTTIQAAIDDANNGIEWVVKLNFDEPDGAYDNVVFCEAPDANDGPPFDDYDQPKPPRPPEPNIYAWLDDNLETTPYQKLLRDCRKYPDYSKAWNLTVEWDSYNYSYIPDITISWDPNDLDDSEYDVVELWNYTEKLADMLTDSNYTYTVELWYIPPNIYIWVPASFQIICRANQPPDAPTIDGQTSGKAGKEYEYTFNATDPDEDDVQYFIDWGDNNTEWTDFHASGTDVKVKHTWNEKGDYTITAKAKDVYGAEGPEETLEVTMPKNKAFNFNLNLLSWLFERFPNAFPILRHLLGL